MNTGRIQISKMMSSLIDAQTIGAHRRRRRKSQDGTGRHIELRAMDYTAAVRPLGMVTLPNTQEGKRHAKPSCALAPRTRYRMGVRCPGMLQREPIVSF
jgi:hypothetical protein